VIAFQEGKDFLVDTFGLSRDALHVHVGLVIYFAAHLVLRRRLGSVMPLVLLLVLCLIGEAWDLIFFLGRGQDPRWLGSAVDIWSTMFWPTLFTIYGRWGIKQD